jgi:hypothetical protein
MTIREHFQRIFKRITYCMVVAAIVVVCVLDWHYPHLTRWQNAGVGLLLGLPFVAVLMLVLRRRFLCPRCGTDLGKLRQQEIRRERRERGWFSVQMQLLWDAWSACPHCGVSFSDPYP